MSQDFIEVASQAELDAAIAAGNIPVCRNGFFIVSGSASVSAYGSASVSASGSASVRAYDSASVRAYGSASVSAYDSASVRAYGSASVRASGSASVSASDSASVRASGSASVRASDSVAVHKHGSAPKISGGVVIDVPECKTATEWLSYYGLEVSRGSVVLFKAVSDDFRSGQGAAYTPGLTVAAEDFKPHTGCGNGLHFCPRPFMAKPYFWDATRFVACRVKVKDIVVIESGSARPSDKVKAASCKALYECDEDGSELVVDQVAA